MASAKGSIEQGVADALIHMGEFFQRMATDPEFAAAQEAQVVEGNPVTISPGTPDAGTWTDDMVAGAKANAARWKRNTLRPKRDPIKAAIDAEPFYESQTKAAMEEGLYGEGLKRTNMEEWGTAVEATTEEDYSKGIEKRKPKILKKVGLLVELHKGRKSFVDEVKPDTLAHRKERMTRNFDAMVAMGIAIKKGLTSLAVK